MQSPHRITGNIHKDLSCEGNLTYAPLYMAMCL